MGKVSQWWKQFKEKEATQKVISFLKKVGFVLKLTFRWCYKLRSLVMSIPVFVCAGALAIRNARLLPDMVGVNILAIKRDGKINVSPSAEFVIEEGDVMVILGDNQALRRVQKL